MNEPMNEIKIEKKRAKSKKSSKALNKFTAIYALNIITLAIFVNLINMFGPFNTVAIMSTFPVIIYLVRFIVRNVKK